MKKFNRHLNAAEDFVRKGDFVKVLVCYQKAAIDSVEAAEIVGDLFYIGEGEIERNYKEALRWYENAAIRGSETARLKFERLQRRFYD